MIEKIVNELRNIQDEMVKYAEIARGGKRPTTTSVALFLDEQVSRLNIIEVKLINRELQINE